MTLQSFEERMRAQRTQLTVPMECEQCGSTHFYDTHAHQFSRGGYGSVEFRQLSPIPVPVKVCIGCGLTVPPQASGGKMHPGSTTEFQMSVKSGLDWREKQRLNANAVASKRELDELKREIDIRLANLGMDPTAPSAPPPPQVAPESTVLDVPDTSDKSTFAKEVEVPSIGDLMKQRTGRQAKNPGKRTER